MVLENVLKVKNYKCFSEVPQGFEKIYPINIIVGKNNSGKSSLIDLIKYVTMPNDSFLRIGRSKTTSEVYGSIKIIESHILNFFSQTTSGGGIPANSFYDYGLTLTNQNVECLIGNNGRLQPIKWEKVVPIGNAQPYVDGMLGRISFPLKGKNFIRINAERDVRPEGAISSKPSVLENGVGTTDVIRQIVNKAQYDSNLIKRRLLIELNKVVNPDIEFLDINPQEIEGNNYEIFLLNSMNENIPLSKMGSGIKTILIVLLQLIVLPEVDNIEKKELVFGFEELENNLHPSLQRRLFNYIADYAKDNGSYFFITTHSSIVIDLFGSNSSVSQILHVINNGDSSIVKSVLNYNDGKSILKDLDYKASDLLLSNGVIWVEGPSDALYIELLIDLYRRDVANEELGRLNFTIQALATAIWRYAGFSDFKWDKVNAAIENQIISLAKVNHNHLIIIDKDDNYEDLKPSEWDRFKNGTGKNKARLIHESLKFAGRDESNLKSNWGETKDNKLFFLITKGTFETYLEDFIINKGKVQFSKYFDMEKTRGYFEKKREGTDNSISKVELASKISKFILEEKLSLIDIAPHGSEFYDMIKRLYSSIKIWK